jgi:hypothetical protein
METTDNVIHIHHEADWSSKALVSWWDGINNIDGHEAAVDAVLLWADTSRDIHLCLPPDVALRAVRLATRGRAKWEYDEVLSRPVPGRVLAPWSERQSTTKRHDPTDAWLFDSDLATKSGPGAPRWRIPLGWVENVAIAMCNNTYDGKVHPSTSVLIDVGAPHRDPCCCGNPLFHAHGCPQSGTFPRIGRLAINLKRVEGFIETMRAARTSAERIFVP